MKRRALHAAALRIAMPARAARCIGAGLLLALAHVFAAPALAQEMAMISGQGESGHAPRISILQPENEATIHANDGNIPVQIAFDTTEQQDDAQVELLLDGKPAPRQGRAQFVLSGVERGAHKLQARLVGPSGAVLARSQPVTFYVAHASRLLPAPH